MSLRTDVKNAAKGSIHGNIVAIVGALLTYGLIVMWEKRK